MINYSLRRSVDPSAEPVLLASLRSYLRYDDDNTGDDTELTALLAVARQAVERDTGRSLITQTWQLRLDDWPADAICLYNPPIQSVTSVTYVDTSGTTQTWASSNYTVDLYSRPGLVRLAYGCSWPSLRGDPRGIVVTYVAGYGASGSNVPAELVHAVKLRARLEHDGWLCDVAEAYDRIIRANAVSSVPGVL